MSADSETATQAADMREAGIGSTDRFDGSLFNTEVTEGYGEHGGRDDPRPASLGFWPGQSLPRLNRGGKIKLVGDLTPRTIAAKRDGTGASPLPRAAGLRIRDDRLRALALSSFSGARAVIGRRRRSLEVTRGRCWHPRLLRSPRTSEGRRVRRLVRHPFYDHLGSDDTM